LNVLSGHCVFGIAGLQSKLDQTAMQTFTERVALVAQDETDVVLYEARARINVLKIEGWL